MTETTSVDRNSRHFFQRQRFLTGHAKANVRAGLVFGPAWKNTLQQGLPGVMKVWNTGWKKGMIEEQLHSSQLW